MELTPQRVFQSPSDFGGEMNLLYLILEDCQLLTEPRVEMLIQLFVL